jgi:DNA-binding IclR family transcriptional regulator
MSEAKYINQSLMDGLHVLRAFMADLSPFVWYSLAELQDALGQDYDYQKVNRIVKTLRAAGFVDIDSTGKRYQLGRDVLMLINNYHQSIERDFDLLEQDFKKFRNRLSSADSQSLSNSTTS